MNTFFVKAQENHASALESNLRKIDIFMEEENYDSVLFYYQQNLLITEKPVDKNVFLSEIGYTYALLSNHEKSAVAFQEALNHALEFTPDSLGFISDQYYYIGYNYHELDDLDKALVFYKKSLSLTSRENDMEGYADILSAITNIYLRKSDYDNAILFGNQALHLYEKIGDDGEIATINNDLALLYYFKQDYSNALKYSEAAIQVIENKSNDLGKRIHISVFNHHALILMKQNKFNEAEEIIEKIFSIHRHSDYEKLFEVSQFNQAFLYYKTEKWGKALAEFKKSINYYIEKYPNGHSNIGKAYYYLGKIKEIQEDDESAIVYFQKSLQSFIPDFEYENNLENPSLEKYCTSKRNLLRTLIAKAKILGRKYSFEKKENPESIDKVFETYNLAVEVSEELRRSYQSEASRYFLAEETKELFEGAVSFSYDLYQKTGSNEYIEKAFFYVEKNQTPILLRNHLAIEGQRIGGVPTDIIQKERQLEIDFVFYKNQKALAEKKQDKRKINLYNEYIFNYKQQLDSLRLDFKKQYPAYFEYQYGNSISTLKEVQKSINDDQLLLQYYVAKNKVFVFSIYSDESNLYLINNVEELKKENEKLLKSIQNPLTQLLGKNESYQQLTHSSYFLYQQLIQPFLIKNNTDINRLMISSSGFLNETPFEVFISELPEKEIPDYLSLKYLIKNFSISYQPSASLMVRLKNIKKRQSEKELLAFAPFSSTEETTKNAFTRSYLGNLPYTRKEVENLEQLFDTKALYNKESSKNTFLQKAKNYKILHLATHGIADFENAANAHLLFYPKNKKDSTGHILYNYEIQNLELNADLVVLSACETGAGKIDRGEGILSLARGFFYTGVPSVIMSKWQINDRSSSIIINELYAGLKSGLDKDKALQNAKTSYLSNEADLITAHPFYWAGLVQLGNSEALRIGGFPWRILSLGLLVLFFLGLLVRKFSK